MARRPKPPVFLGRDSYRQRRIRDAARMTPVFGAVLWAVPLLWERGTAEAVRTSQALIYIFAVWALLILVALLLSRLLKPDQDDAEREEAD
jgi:hypothetical protein